MNEEDKNMLSEKEQIEEAKSTLEGITGWINSCDSKAGIILAFLGVLLGIILTNEGLEALYQVLLKAGAGRSLCGWLYIILTVIAIVVLGWGVFKLVLVLFATIESLKYKKENLELDSKVFFGTISNNATYSSYKEKYVEMSRKDYLNDLLSQIYINSLIARKKYTNYNTGVRYSIIGFCCFIVMFLIGVYCYL